MRALALLFVAASALADTSVGPITSPGVQPMRGTSNVGTPVADEAACWVVLRADAETRAASANYRCRVDRSARITYTPPVNPCPPKPADLMRTQTCTAPEVGSWTQTQTYIAAPAPTCWTAGAWVPSTPPLGACTVPPPPPPPAVGTSIWPSGVPATAAATDAGAVTLGTRFTSTVAGQITGIRFYKGTGNNGPHVGTLYSNTGQLLSQGTFSNETATGWQQMAFAAPIAIAANTSYVVAYHAPVGRYALNANFGWPVTNGTLSGQAGLFAYGSSPNFPTQTWNASNYWVDVIFSTVIAPPPPPATGTASLTWDAHQDPTVTGYRVYSRLGSAVFPAFGTGVLVVTNNYSYSALASGTWCFAVTAVSPGGESAPSTEACKVIP